MRLITILSLLMLSVSAWAGTFKDDFEDGNWDGWKGLSGGIVDVVEEERFSVIEGVLHMDTRVPVVDTLGYDMGLAMMRDWTDYSFSADARVIQVEPGH
jgi:hypothetical protein